MNIINTSKISKITALGGAVIVFGAITMAATPAFAHGYNDGYNNYNGGNSYYGGGSYYPISSPSSAASAASASATSNSNTNVNVNVNVPITINGGGYVAQPVYQPIVYNPAPTYYGNYSTPTYAYTSPAYNYNNYPSYSTYPTTSSYGNGYNSYNYGTGLSATCSANTATANIGQSVTWTASVTGGTGYYTYTWSGSNNLYGSGSSINAIYNNNGQQYAQVTVNSNGQSVTAQCTNTVNVGGYNYNGNSGVNGNGLTVGCAADVATARIGQAVTWSVEATGGNGNTYAWSGTNGLSGSQTSIVTAYQSAGSKQATVIVTSSNGQVSSQSCTPITVVGNGGNGNSGNGSGNTNVNPNANGNNSSLSAASLFSLANIPWGWVAVLIILVLFGTVMYMLFNKSKI